MAGADWRSRWGSLEAPLLPRRPGLVALDLVLTIPTLCRGRVTKQPYLSASHRRRQLISLRISGLDDLASMGLPTVVEGLQRRKAQSKRRPEMTGHTLSDEKVSMEFRMFGNKPQKKSYLPWVQTGPLYRDPWDGYLSK